MKLRSNSLCCLAVATLVATSANTVCADDWPLVRGDTMGSGVAKCAVPDKLDTLWTYNAPKNAGFEATAVVANRLVYVGDNDGTFHAVRLDDGQLIWKNRYENNTVFLAGGAIDGDKLYVCDGNGVVRCLAAADGSEVWHAEVPAEVHAGGTIADGKLLVTCEAGVLACFDAAIGKELWRFQIDAPLRCSPTIIAGHALLAGCDSKLHFIDITNGEESETVAIDAPTGNTAAIRGDRVYFGTEGGTFFAVEAAVGNPAAVAWSERDPERSQSIRSAAAVNDQLVVYGSQGKAIYGRDPASGEVKWKLPTRSRVDSSPVIAGERVVAATDRGVLYVLDAATSEIKWQFEAGGGFAASPVVVDGRIILGNTDGTLYCFGAKDAR